MNCKPGDLAVIVRGRGIDQPLIGKIIRVTSISITVPWVCWFYEGTRLRTILGEVLAVGDHTLRPLRGQEGEDETLSWVDVPMEAA